MTQTFQNGVPISLESTQNELAFPTGAITPFAGTATPTGTVNSVSAWLICNGASYGTATYPTLFNAIGYTYGGSGTAFNVPDLRGRMPMGAGTGTGLNASGTASPTGTAQTARTVGAWGGEETHLLTTAETPAHTHTFSGNTGTELGYPNYGVAYIINGRDRSIASSGAGWGLWSTPDGYSHYHSFSGNTGSIGSGNRSSVVPPFIVINYIIKT
jgi:microcystin-dependent protein